MSKLQEVFTPAGRKLAAREVHAWQEATWEKRWKRRGQERKDRVTKSPMGTFNLLHSDWQPVRLSVPEQIPSARLLSEVENPQLIADPQTGQQLNTILANREVLAGNPDQAVTVWSSLYMNTINNDDENAYRILELARQMPNRSVLAFDYPNMGGSDRLTPEQKSTKKKDSYFEVADAQLRIMKELGITKINLVGSSMGGFASLALAVRAAKHGVQVENLIVIDSPGGKHMPAPLLTFRDLREAGNLDRYHSSPADPAMEVSRKKISVGKALSDWLTKDPWFVYLRSMTKATIFDRAVTALTDQPDMNLVFVNGSESQVSPVRTITDIVKRLQDQVGKERVSQILFSGEGHLTNVQPKRLASLVKSQLDGTFL
jgi:pimeloyl-ACP methyl ester carboxylesterase